MSFRLHTHVCVNNSFSFFQVPQEASQAVSGGLSRVKGSGKPALGSSLTPGATVPTGESGEPCGPGDTFSAIKGFLERWEGVPFTEQTWPSMSDQKFDSYRERDWNHHLNAYNPKGHLFLKNACQTVPSLFPHWELLLKIHEIKKQNKKPTLTISHLNTKAKQSSKYLMK